MILPGQVLNKNAQGKCHFCHDAEATLVVVGECDSFGHEELHLCKPCQQEAAKDCGDRECEWCRKVTKVSPLRPADEPSMCYDVCQDCRRKHRQAELPEDDDDGSWDSYLGVLDYEDSYFQDSWKRSSW